MLQKISSLTLMIFFASIAFAQHHMTNTIGYADSINSGLIGSDTMKGSPHRVNMANIGPAHVHIEYGSPGVKGRVIWGGLVPWDKVWVTGAGNATIISFGKDVIWGGKPVPAGIYGFFTIPGKDKWILILNKNSEMHLADDYDEKNDVVRIEVKPNTLAKSVQRLSYIVRETGKSKGEVIMQWEKIEIKIPVTVK
jgi:hypothetical protein